MTTFSTYLFTPGLSHWTIATAIGPASTLVADAMLYKGKTLQTAIFGIAISAAILSGIWLMVQDELSQIARIIFYASAIAAGLQQMLWGYQLGEPSMAVTSGGGFYLVSGVSLFAFTLAALYFQTQRRAHMCHETMIFAENFAFAPALLIWGHGLWYLLDVIPAYYIDRGHGYVLAAGAAILTPTLNGVIGMMTSRETQSRAIS